ncbi:MAG: nucleotidyltransferase substrate binding protein [Candidatus Caenarcaniphilales bacterium]|nr:nucleotidyltransferase substrate binding protein [Candidatus Caenarcaniphilales bacterium]
MIQAPNDFKDSFLALKKALLRLSEALKENYQKNHLVIDAAIQRFEFCIELMWKNLKRFLEYEGINASSPREVLKEAFAINMISEEEIWLNMLRARNLTSHTYNEDTAMNIYQELPDFYQKMKETVESLEEKYYK